MKKSRSILSSLIRWELVGKSNKRLIKLFDKFLSRLNRPEDCQEIFYALIDLGPKKFGIIVSKLRDKLSNKLRNLSVDRLKVLLLYMSQTCLECLRIFLEKFRREISQLLEKTHFNDIVILALNISLLNEEAGIIFIRELRDTLRKLALSEGFNHFGTVLWYMATMKQVMLAKHFIDITIDIITNKSETIVEIGDFLYWLSRGNDELGLYAFNAIKNRLSQLLEKATIHQIAQFLVIISKHDKISKKIAEELLPSIRGRLKRPVEVSKLLSLLEFFHVDTEILNLKF